MKRTIICIAAWVFALPVSRGQEWLGIRNSNYAGIQGAFLNPSSIASSFLKQDIQPVAGSTLFNNNFFYAPKSQLSPFGFGKIVNGAVNENLFRTRFDPAQPNKLYQMTFGTEITGPAAFTRWRDNLFVGFSLALRGYANVRDITGHLAQNLYADFKDPDLWNKDWQDHTAALSGLAWLEYGFHLATVLSNNQRSMLTAGITLNYLQGMAAAYSRNTVLNYKITDSSTLIVSSSSADYGGTKYPDNQKPSGYNDLHHGAGWSGSLGLTYTRFKDIGCTSALDGPAGDPYRPYVWKLGISLLDVGLLSLNRNSAAYHFEAGQSVYDIPVQTASSSNRNPVLQSITKQNDSNKVQTASRFNMALPSAVSLQADWNLYNHFFANVTLIKGWDHKKIPGITRPDVYALSVRYETDWLELSVPFSVVYYGDWQPRIGLALRIGYFYFGGDSPFDLLGIQDFQKVDFYAGVHLFPLEKKRRRNGLSCPDTVL